MNIIPSFGKALARRFVHKVLGGRPSEHEVVRQVKLSDILSIPSLNNKKGKVKLEVIMDLPLDLVFDKTLKLSSSEDIIISSGGNTHFNPMWSDGTPVSIDQLRSYEQHMENLANAKRLETSDCGCCAPVPKYTADEFSNLVKRVNSLENLLKNKHEED